MISGPLTELEGSPVDGVGSDATGTLYADNSGGHAIRVFAPGANGNVAPIRTIGGANTLLGSMIYLRSRARRERGLQLPIAAPAHEGNARKRAFPPCAVRLTLMAGHEPHIAAIQKKIEDLSAKRQKKVDEARAKGPKSEGEKALDEAMKSIVREQAKAKGFEVGKQK